MIRVIKNAKIFAPKYVGKADVVFDNKIIHIGKDINPFFFPFEVEIYDASGLLLLPGLIDPHVHITGGGGEGGFETRTPELKISDCIKNGITTVIGCLGTDGVTRSLENLYAKAKALENEGLNTFIYTGSYRVPPVTFTGSVMRDMVLIDKVIGVGEIAISDHRSSHPTFEEILRIVADARVGGMISGKPGIVNFHVGAGREGINYLFEIIRNTEIPVQHLYPTHMNRSKWLFEQGLEFASKGGVIDLTALQPKYDEPCKGEFNTVDAIFKAYENELLRNITISSDGQGSLPKFDEIGNFVGLDVGSVSSVWHTICKVVGKGLPLEEAIQVSTINPAKVFRLNKGRVERGYDADFILVNEENLEIVSVVSKGEFLMKDGVLKNLNFEF